MRRLLFVVALLLVGCIVTEAQIVVSDPAVTERNSATAIVREYLLNIQRAQSEQLRRMTQRLGAFTTLDKYAIADVPEWRIHVFFDAPEEPVLFAGYGARRRCQRSMGRAHSWMLTGQEKTGRVNSRPTPRSVSPTQRQIRTRLGVVWKLRLELTHRPLRNRERPRCGKAQRRNLTPRAMPGAQLLVGIVEQLLVDSKRERDTEASVMNMQLATWRDGGAAGHAFVAGSGDALRTWRQP